VADSLSPKRVTKYREVLEILCPNCRNWQPAEGWDALEKGTKLACAACGFEWMVKEARPR